MQLLDSDKKLTYQQILFGILHLPRSAKALSFPHYGLAPQYLGQHKLSSHLKSVINQWLSMVGYLCFFVPIRSLKRNPLGPTRLATIMLFFVVVSSVDWNSFAIVQLKNAQPWEMA